MTHLTPEEFVELVDGSRTETDTPHLRVCVACQQTLTEWRRFAGAVKDVEVPEPSPLFWDHLSRRVREAVAAEGAPREQWWQAVWRRRPNAVRLTAAVVTLTVAAAVTGYLSAPRRERASTPSAETSLDTLSLLPPGAADDPTLSLVAELLADLDLDSADEAGLTAPAHVGGADDVVSTLTADELQELQRLLQEELAKPRA